MSLLIGCASTGGSTYSAQQMEKGFDLAAKKSVCYNLKSADSKIIPIKEFEKRLTNGSQIPLSIRYLKGVVAIAYSEEYTDNGTIFIPNRPLVNSPIPPEEIGIHELIHTSLTYGEAKELTAAIKKLGIKLPIDKRDDENVETPAYLINYMLRGEYKHLREKIVPLYLKYDISLPCIDERLA